jgi:cyclophilin family peptidyl-prolyl cis-trans isomerase
MLQLRVLFFLLMLSGIARAELSDGLYADFDTSMGSFTCRLDYVEAPLTCANFVGLAEGTQSWIDPESGAVRNDPFYTDRIFHRVIDGFMIQGGCPLGNGSSGPGYTFPDEIRTNLTHFKAGILSMANSGPDSNGSQFFITLAPTSGLDGVHSVFGDVIDGIGVVTNIGSVTTTTNDRPIVDVVINQVQILRIGTEAEQFDVSAQPLPEVTNADLSLTKTAEGLLVKAEITNQLEVSMYSSTNLVDWALLSKKYWSATTNLFWNNSTTSDQGQEFFRGNCVLYPQAIPGLLSDVEGHTLHFQQGEDVITATPYGEGGSCTITGTPDSMTYWSWDPGKYSERLTLIFYTELGYRLAFETFDGLGNGEWSGYQQNGLQWSYIGPWVFTDTVTP